MNRRMHNTLLATFALLTGPVAFAAGGMPDFFAEVSILIVASAVIGYGCFRLGLVPIIGFLLTGVLLGVTGLVDNPELIDAVAEVGVILLLFTIGIEFSLDNLMRIRRLLFVGGGVQVGLVTLIVTTIMLLSGVDWRASLFTGMLVALSSTAIVMKLLDSRGETNAPAGQISLGILIFQDLAVVGMVILVPILGGEGATLGSVALSLGSAAAIIAAILLLARRVMPTMLEALARTCSQEIFVLGVIAVCFGTAYLTGLAGVSLSLGAFLAGLLVSESRFGSQALGEILPLQIIFSAAFFVSVGLLLDLAFLVQNLPVILAVIVGVLLIKTLAATAGAFTLGYPLGVSLAAGLTLAQVGEFSFVLQRSGSDVGLFPAGLEGAGEQTIIAATVLLMGITPNLATLGNTINARLERRRKAQERAAFGAEEGEAEGLDDLSDHVLIAGYGAGGKLLASVLQREEVPFGVVTLSPTGATEAEAAGMRAMRGDYTKNFILNQAGILRSRMLAILDDEPEHAARVIEVVRGLDRELPILTRAQFYSGALSLKRAGSTTATAEEIESLVPLLSDVLTSYGSRRRDPSSARSLLIENEPNVTVETVQLSEQQRTSEACSHQEETKVVTPDAEVCLDCVAQGDTWVHLRVCMTCGHVGCCDSSKNQHASKHAQRKAHPIIKSFEKGESWAYCYTDEVTLT